MEGPVLTPLEWEYDVSGSPSDISMNAEFLRAPVAFSDGMVMMDPHAAHERVHYEAISSRAEGRVQTQNLTFPFSLPPSLSQRARSVLEELRKLGFLFDEQEGDLRVTGVPDLFRRGAPLAGDLVRTALDALDDEEGGGTDLGLWRRWATLACKRSVKLGESMDRSEALTLWQELARCENPHSCPHGRPVFLAVEPGQRFAIKGEKVRANLHPVPGVQTRLAQGLIVNPNGS